MKHHFKLAGGLVISLIAISATGWARSVPVTEEDFPRHMEDASLTVSLNIDKENLPLGRAWVELAFSQPRSRGDMPDEVKVIRKNVPGLQFNAQTQEITYQAPGTQPVVCAQLKDKSFLFFHSSHLETTGNCVLTTKKLPASKDEIASRIDDGFAVHYEPVAEVELSVKD